MALKMFDIRFSNQAGAFYAGQTVTGIVILEIDEAVKLNAITLKFDGRAEVSWLEKDTSSSSTAVNENPNTQESQPLQSTDRNCSANEQYIEKIFNLFGTGQETLMNAGYHQFDFSFNLPMNIPSSFEGDHGNVRYICRAEVVRSGFFSGNWERRVPFTVISLYDLNRESKALESGRASEVHTLGCLCCVRGDINTTMSIPRVGYVGGEDIYFTAIINNNSSKGVTSYKAELIQEVTYKGSGSEKISSTVINKHDGTSIDPMDTQTVSNVPLRVPPLPPSGLIHCTIIDLKYQLKLTVVPSGFHMDVVSRIDLIIGTIPLQSTFGNFQQPATQAASYPAEAKGVPGAPMYTQDANALPTAPFLPVQDYPQMPPPSYAESMFKPPPGGPGGSYCPRYPYYNAGDTAPQSYYPAPIKG